MKYEIREVDLSKRDKLNSSDYTFTKTPDLKLFELVIFPYYGDKDYHPDDQEWELDGIEFWAKCKETAIAELTAIIKAYDKAGFLDEWDGGYDIVEYAKKNGLLSTELCQLISLFGIDISKLYGTLSMVDFLELDNHYRYVIRKLEEKVVELKSLGVIIKNNKLTYIRDDFETLVLK